MVNQVPSLEEIYEVRQKLTAMWHEHWLQHDFILIPMVAINCSHHYTLGTVVEMGGKKKMLIILLYGTLLTIFILLLDSIGDQLNLWTYPYKITRLFPQLGSADLAVFPVLHMLIYQYFKKWFPLFGQYCLCFCVRTYCRALTCMAKAISA